MVTAGFLSCAKWLSLGCYKLLGSTYCNTDTYFEVPLHVKSLQPEMRSIVGQRTGVSLA